MKNILSASLVFLMAVIGNAQNDAKTKSVNLSYGIKGGYNSFTERFSFEGDSASESGSGFYLGFFTDFSITDKISIQPELLYILVTQYNTDGDVLVFPIMGKYKVKESFGILLGPQLDYILEKDVEDIKRLGLGLAAGVTFDISQSLFMDMRFSYGLSNRLGDAYDGFDAKLKVNFLQIGLGYKFK
ncbi:porin family protein [Winogradskyella poriferorum]|uniref:porin family protein n=1 Tax=Winogradskyella poriferorum TaxID=307627 RepID=UPI003D654757